MGLRYNPFTGSFDMTRSPGSYLDGEVAAYSDLPLDAAAAPLNSAWLVRAGSGLWLLTRKPAGIYIRTATGGTDRDADYTYAGTFPDVFSDANFVVYNDADSTKNLKLDTSGIDTATTRTLTVPNASGTLPLLETANTFSANQTLNGTNNTAPNQTAASGSSIMTRDLVDARASLVFWFVQTSANASIANGAARLLGPAGNNTFSNAYGFSIPSVYTKFRIVWWGAWSSAPTTASFPTYVRFNNPATLGAANQESAHGTRFAVTAYPDDATGLTGTLTAVGNFPIALTTYYVYRYVSDTITIPAGWQTNAATNGGYNSLGFFIGNNSGGALTDGYNASHGFRGYMEFLK
jgi:hypothetical protein